MRVRSGLVVVLAMLFGALPLAHAQTEGSISIGLAEAPTTRADDPRAKVYIVDHVSPGTTITRRVRVSNNTNATQEIGTYAAAASVRGGQFRFGDGRAVNELTTWTTVVPSNDGYAAGESKEVVVTIAVPENASEGERYAVVWASVSSGGDGAITNVNRVGVRIYLSVGPGGEPPSDFEIDSIQARRTKAGAPQVVAEVHNTGGRALDLSGTLNLEDGPGGLRAGPFAVKVGTTLGIGQTAPVAANLDKALPAGPWKATLELESGLTKRRASATVTFPKSGAGPEVRPRSSSSRDVLVLLVVAAVAGGLFFVYLGRRRRPGDPDAGPDTGLN